MKKPIIVANWKSNPQTLEEAKELFNLVKEGIVNIKEAKVVICPPFVYLSHFKISKSQNISLGAQNCFFQLGPFTGEVSPQMLKNLGCQYVIVGHSERRALGESDELINKKVKVVLEKGLKPILCVGEKEKDTVSRFKEIKNQLRGAFSTIEKSKLENIILAYEPVWAIGTGEACNSKEAKEANSFIKQVLAEFFGVNIAKNTPVLYGGSVNSEIAAVYIQESEMDGLLVGGASLNAEEFIKIIKAVSEAVSEVALPKS